MLGYSRAEDRTTLHEDDTSVGTRFIESASSKKDALLSLLKSFVRNRPYSYAKYASGAFAESVDEAIASGRYDVLIIDHAQMGWLLERRGTLPVIVIEHNVEYDLYRKLYHETPVLKWPLKALYRREYRLMYGIEKTLIAAAAQVWTLNDDDKRALAEHFGAEQVHAIHIPGGFDTYADLPKTYGVAMLGTWSWEANRKGLEWFVDAVMPYLDARIDVHVGGVGAEWIKGRYANLVHHGFVEDAQAFLARARCIAVPSTSGSGIQIKTLDAISTGVPVVTTSVGVRGIDALPQSVSVADDPRLFAQRAEAAVSGYNAGDRSGHTWSVRRKSAFEATLSALLRGISGKGE